MAQFYDFQRTSMSSPLTALLTLRIPAPVSSVSFGTDHELFVGSDDGSVRVYNLPSTRVFKAINNLGSDVSSLVTVSRQGAGTEELWLSCGPKVLKFSLENPKMILNVSDAAAIIELGEDQEDVLNEISISPNNKLLAFSTDGGTVGVVDLNTKQITRMKTRHTSICGSVRWIPERPNEIISGGYDSALLHFDIIQGSISSRQDFVAPPPSDGVSLAPPFVQSISLSASGTIAASTADGRVWLGHGGEKKVLPAGSKKKRSRKWEGLKSDEGVWVKVAEGPIVSVIFNDPSSVTTCTLLGTVTNYQLADGKWDAVWTTRVEQLVKVNSMQIQGVLTVFGGFNAASKGVVEVFRIIAEPS